MGKRRNRKRSAFGGTMSTYSCISPISIAAVVSFLASEVVNAFAHGARSVMISARHAKCAWVVSADVAIDAYCTVAMYDEDAPLEMFLAARTAVDPDRASYTTVSAIVSEIEGTVAHPRGWRCMAIEPLVPDPDEPAPETLGDLGALVGEHIARALASGANHLRCELYGNERIIIIGDDGDPESVFRCVEDSGRQLGKFLEQDISVVYGGQNPRMGAFIEA
ncbi:hypothetical protein HY480_05080 [Candidatus Uhrbacteria bacterium]|nr:hypothetical protein [Candidatus Uhrbacteria bacterium]